MISCAAMPNKSSGHLGTNQCFWRFSKISWHFLKVWVGLKIWPSWKISSYFGKFPYWLLIFLYHFYKLRVTNSNEKSLIFAHFLIIGWTPWKNYWFLLIFLQFSCFHVGKYPPSFLVSWYHYKMLTRSKKEFDTSTVCKRRILYW